MLVRLRTFRAALMRAFPVMFAFRLALALRFRLRCCGSFCNGFCGGFRSRFRSGFSLRLRVQISSMRMRNLFRRRGCCVPFGHFGMRFAEIAGSIGFGFVFRGNVMGSRFFGRFRGWRQFFGCHVGFLGGWAWPASASSSAATTAAASIGASAGTTRRGGQV